VNILTYTSIYPNNCDPSHGIYVERRLVELIQTGNFESTVVCPVPWFPFRSSIFGRYADFGKIVRRSRRSDIDIHYCRFPAVPAFGTNMSARLMATATRKVVRRIAAETEAELIDAHYFYPDGVAASIIGRSLRIPYIITARGSDINLLATLPGPRRQMIDAAEGAAAIIAVSSALAERMTAIGMPASKIHVLRNGVDLNFFSPAVDCAADQNDVGHSPGFISVGTLKKNKGHDIAIEFISGMPGAKLKIIGQGEAESGLRALARQLKVENRVIFTGTLDPESLRREYRNATALILMSEREGLPNVVLESLACGTPVLATRVGGIPEILNDRRYGELVVPRSAAGLRSAWERLSSRQLDRENIRARAGSFSWGEVIGKLEGVMQRAVSC
jgi:teichuronic acid biosynthesis glycosyltransferase TuaC